MKFRTNKSKKTILSIVLIALSCILVFGLVFGIAKTVGDKDTKTIHPSFSVGSLTADGKYEESENQIYTKKAFECTGLNVALDFDAEITYQIFFYNYDGTFLESTTSLSEHYKDSAPLFATHARIVITPNEDEEIKFYEVSGYANQISIKVDKVQGFDDNLIKSTYKGVGNLSRQSGYFSEYSNGYNMEIDNSANSYLFNLNFGAEFYIFKVSNIELNNKMTYGDSSINTFIICERNADGDLILAKNIEVLGEFEDYTYLKVVPSVLSGDNSLDFSVSIVGFTDLLVCYKAIEA